MIDLRNLEAKEIKSFQELEDNFKNKDYVKVEFEGKSKEKFILAIQKVKFWKEVNYEYYFVFLDKNWKSAWWAWNWQKQTKVKVLKEVKEKMVSKFWFKNKKDKEIKDLTINLSVSDFINENDKKMNYLYKKYKEWTGSDEDFSKKYFKKALEIVDLIENFQNKKVTYNFLTNSNYHFLVKLLNYNNYLKIPKDIKEELKKMKMM